MRAPYVPIFATTLLAMAQGNPRLAPPEVVRQGLTARASGHVVHRIETPASVHSMKLGPAELEAARKQIEKITTMRRNKTMPPVPDDPNAVRRFGLPLDPEVHVRGLAKGPQPLAPTDVTVATNTSLMGVGGTRSQIAEPATAEGTNGRIFYTSNWFAAYSTNGGTSFNHVNPVTFFPSSYGGFCCDQDVIYDPHTGLFLWYLQYLDEESNPRGNVGRLAFTTDPSGTWQYLDIRPDDVAGTPFSATDWFDYPALALSNNYVYISSNVFTAGASASWAGAQLVRLHLGELRSLVGGGDQALPAGSVTSERIWSTSNTLYTPTQDSRGTVYAFDHVTNTSLRVFAWPESSSTATPTDVSHASFNSSGYNCAVTGVTNSNACQRMDSRPYAAWVNDGKIGLLWPAAQGTDGLGTFAYPYVRTIVLNESTKAIVREFAVHNSSYAYFFPSGAVNAAGALGGTIGFAGGTTNPSFALYIADAASGGPSTFPDFQISTVAGGAGEQPNASGTQRWGDYSRTRISTANPYQWIGTHFNLKGTTRPSSGSGSTDPRYLVWRRDLPTSGAPTISHQPQSLSVIRGRSATFGVLAAGSGSLSYQWKKNGTALPGATGTLYTLGNVQDADSGSVFTVDVTNAGGTTASTSATLTVTAAVPVSFNSQPASVKVAPGFKASFLVSVSGSGPFTYQWKKNGTDISGATSAAYQTPALQLPDNGAIYACRVTGMAGPATSNGATVTVAALGAATVSSNSTEAAIPDSGAGTLEVPFVVSGVSGGIGEVTLGLYITHTYVADLKVSLIAPDNTVVMLASNPGGNASNSAGGAFGSSCSNLTVFSDLGSASIQTQTKDTLPWVGTYIPFQTLTAFNDKSANGTWKVKFEDVGRQDIGTFKCGTLTVKPFSSSTVSVAIAGASSLQMDPGASRNFTATVSNATDNRVNWTASAGSFSPTQTAGDGVATASYTAPSTPQTVTLTATSVESGAATATVTVNVYNAAAVTVAVSPTPKTLVTGGSATFAATVANTPGNDQSVTWSVQGGSANGAITAAGVYTAPATAGTYTVVATSPWSSTPGTASVVVKTRDLNGDSAVDVLDILEMTKRYGSTASADLTKADLDGDGDIDDTDLSTLLAGL